MRRDGRVFIWLLAGVAVLGVVAVVVVRRSGGRPRGEQGFGEVAFTAFGEEWAKRLHCSAARLRAALTQGRDPDLLRGLDEMIGPVEFSFDGSARPRSVVDTTVLVAYAGDGQRSTAKVILPWDDVPPLVRAALIGGRDEMSYTWRALPVTPAA